jgi:hypothetical protein
MGCDIHLYIEYKSKKPRYDGRESTWRDFGQRINPGRNYALFALMADVRNYDGQLPVIVKPRGMPDDAGYYSSYDNCIYISENTYNGERTVTMEHAKRWVESGSSKFINNQQGEPKWVTNPDGHSHSWLNTSEFETVINKYLELEAGWHKERVDTHNKMVEMVAKENIQPSSWIYAPPTTNDEPQYQVVLASMKGFEEIGYDARIVFWFDN